MQFLMKKYQYSNEVSPAVSLITNDFMKLPDLFATLIYLVAYFKTLEQYFPTRAFDITQSV